VFGIRAQSLLDVQHAAVFSRQFNGNPLQPHRGICPKVNRNVKHRAATATYQFASS
jgi:hypothetical protein